VATIVVHGGAGRWAVPEERRQAVKRALEDAVREGLAAMQRGGAVDGVVAAVEYMETCGLFNAGYGSVYALDGRVYMDAGVIDGAGRAGAVAAVEGVKSAVRLARAVMELTDHVILTGERAALLAKRLGLTAPFYN